MTTNGDVLIRVENLQKAFGDFHALNGITEEIHKGEVVVIIGPSGSGKSTFLRSLNLLEVPTGGHIYFEGVDITDAKVDIDKHRQKMGMVFQHFNLFPHKTIKENITLAPIKLLGKSKEEADKRAMELLERVGLAEKADSYPSQLSGGQKQRLCIARALLKKPKVLILDDSTSAVDTATDAKIRRAFREEIPDTTKLIIAQRVSSVQDADRIIVMDEGQVHGFGTHEELLKTDEIYREVYESQTQGGGDFDENGGEA